MDMNLGKLRETARDREAWLQSMGSQGVGHDCATEQQRQLSWQECAEIVQSMTDRLYDNCMFS